MWWEQDGVTRLAVLYIESFGNPRKFARTARRVAASMPVLAVEAGRSAAGQRAAASHTAAAATPWVTREALFDQAGIIAVPGFGDLIEAAALLATQPVPKGTTVAIVSNVGGAGVLAADACTDLGLTVHRAHRLTRHRLRALIPPGGAADRPDRHDRRHPRRPVPGVPGARGGRRSRQRRDRARAAHRRDR